MEIPVETLRKMVARERCERSLLAFVRYFWHVLEPLSRKFAEGWHLEAICEHLEAITGGDIQRLLINVPPGAMKSMLTDVFWPAWEWGPRNMPATRYIATSYSHHLTKRDNQRFLRLIQSREYQEFWGDRFEITHTSEENVKNDKTGFKLATSIGGVGTGERADRIIFDDPHNVHEAESDAVRQAAVDYFKEVLQLRVNDRFSAFVVIMQRVHEGDVSGEILGSPVYDYVHLMIPMEFDPRRRCGTTLGWEDPRTEDGELFWPEHFPRESVEREKFTLGPYAVAAQFQQEPAPRGGGILKRVWWLVWPPGGEDNENPNYVAKFPDVEFTLASVDTALTTKTTSDESALTIWGVFREAASLLSGGGLPGFMRDEQVTPAVRDRQIVAGLGAGERKPLDYEGAALVGRPGPIMLPRAILMYGWAARVEFHELLLKVIHTCRKYKVDRLLVEGKVNGFAVTQEVIRLCGEEKWGTELIDPKVDKLARAHSVVPVFSAGMVYAPDRSWADRVITQCEIFPKGKHDDLVDTTTQGLKWLRDNGMLLLQGETEADAQRALLSVPRGGRMKAPYDV